MKRDIYYINILKIIACFLVIVNHTNSSIFINTSSKVVWYISIIIFFISKMAVPIFMMASGALLLSKEYTYKKCFTKIFKYVLILVIISILFYYINNHNLNLLVFFKQLYSNQISVHLWYLYFYIAFLLGLPILQKLVKNMNNIDFIIFFIVSFVIYGGVFIFFPHYISGLATQNYLYLFWTYTGYLLAGYYIENRLKIKNTTRLNILLLSIVILFTLINTSITNYEKIINPNYYLFLDNIQVISIALPAISLFLLIRNIWKVKSIKINKIIMIISSTTFLIYLIHILFVGKTQFILQFLNSHLQINISMLLYEVFIFIGCTIISFIIMKIPYINKLFK